MNLNKRHVLDRSFSIVCILGVALMVVALVTIMGPIFAKGIGAFIFKGTVEHRKVMRDVFERQDKDELEKEIKQSEAAKQKIYNKIAAFEEEIKTYKRKKRREMRYELKDFKAALRDMIGPIEGDIEPVMMRGQYGQTRWDRTLVKYKELMNVEEWDHSDPTKMGVKILKPRADIFKGTALATLFTDELALGNVEKMLQPEWTFYWRFLFDEPHDANMFGGIWPAVLGTIYLTLGAMIFAIPMGIIAAIYLVEYAKDTWFISVLRSCISTLAGVPSIVFGLFGLAFFINTMQVSESKSVLAGALTLGLLVLPTIIRASEEAIKSVPHTYKEASLGLGATRWYTIVTVILPAALPGILTGIVISMGRAAGETAPIIFTAAVSIGSVLAPWEVANNPTPALPWNIYNLCTEHEAVDEIRHVQFGMVFTLIMIVLILNLVAIAMRARMERKLRG